LSWRLRWIYRQEKQSLLNGSAPWTGPKALWEPYRTKYLHNGGAELLDAYKWVKPVEEYLRDGILYY
jgi:hypothetical protein